MESNIHETQPLARFMFARDWTTLKGTYIYPLSFVGKKPIDPNDYLKVVSVVDCGTMDVAITGGGGLFARDREQYRSEGGRDTLVDTFNLLLCELALFGVVSQPVTDLDIQDAKLIDKHASITGGWGMYGERTWAPYALLTAPVRDMSVGFAVDSNDIWAPHFYWVQRIDPKVLEQLNGLPRAVALHKHGAAIPTLVTAAAFHSSRHNLAETMLSSWMVVEAIVGSLWRQYIASVGDKDRRRRLEDYRTYTASVQAEVLLTTGSLDEATYSSIQHARKVRNDLAHKGLRSRDAVAICVEAMRLAMDTIGVSSARLAGFSRQVGGMGPPRTELDPGFNFR